MGWCSRSGSKSRIRVPFFRVGSGFFRLKFRVFGYPTTPLNWCIFFYVISDSIYYLPKVWIVRILLKSGKVWKCLTDNIQRFWVFLDCSWRFLNHNWLIFSSQVIIFSGRFIIICSRSWSEIFLLFSTVFDCVLHSQHAQKAMGQKQNILLW